MANKKNPTYRVICIPKASPHLAELVTKSRTARLHALEIDPTSFFAQHATESALPLHVWEKRLCDPETTVLACVATPSSTTSDSVTSASSSTFTNGSFVDSNDETNLLTGEWVGFAAVRGPMSMDNYYVTPDMGLPIPERPEEEARWHLFDLYTLPQHRGRGLAKKLLSACVGAAIERTRRLASCSLSQEEGEPNGNKMVSRKAGGSAVKQARIRLFMNPKNEWLIKVYEAFGFQAAGKVTLEEGFRANALDESIPKDTRENEEVERLWHTRFGLAMEQVVDVWER